MEVTIKKLKINRHDSIPNPNNTLSASHLNLHTLSIAAPEVSAVADVAEDAIELFSDFDDYFFDDYFFDDESDFFSDDFVLVAEEKKPVVVDEDEKVIHMDLAEKDVSGMQLYTVHVDGHRILTVVTSDNKVAAGWIRQVLSCCGKKNAEIIVGVYVDKEHPRFEKGAVRESNYDIIQLCVGSQCLIYELPDQYSVRNVAFPFPKLFANRHVIAAGVNMTEISKKLFNDHAIRFSNVMDLNEVPEKVLENGFELNLKRYDLSRLAKLVLGENWYIERPKKKRDEWYSMGCLSMKKVKYATYDAYTSYMIGAKLLEMKREKMNATFAGKKGNKRRGNNHN